MKLSIIVPVKDQLQFTQWCLWSISQRTKNEFEIIIIDDLSEKKTKNWLIEFSKDKSNVKYFRNENQLWHTGSCNKGVKESIGEYICLMNSDAIVPDNWDLKMLEILEKDQQISCIGPRTSSAASIQQIDNLYNKRYNYKFHDINNLQKEIENENVDEFIKAKITGFCMIFSKKKWIEIGEFDSNIPSGGNEGDWQIRGLKLGYYPMVSLKSYVHHFGKVSYSAIMKSDERSKVWQEGNKIIIKKHGKEYLELIENKFWRNLKIQSKEIKKMKLLNGKPIDIITITHNRMQFVGACLWSVINYTDYPYRLIVIDNASTDGTKEWLIDMKNRNFIQELILNDKNLGIADAKNQGLELVNWESNYCILTDSDIVLPLLKPDWIIQMFETMERHPNLGMLSCDLDPINHNPATHGWWYKQRQTKKDDLDLIVTGFHMTIIPKFIHDKIKEKNNSKVFWGDSLYGEVDAHYREAVQAMGYWVGVQKNVKALHLGWSDQKFFNDYDLMKRKERFKAEEIRRQREKESK